MDVLAVIAFVLAAIVMTVIAVMLFVYAVTIASAQSPDATQRELDRLEAELARIRTTLDQDRLADAQIQLDGFTRLAAVEREVELSRTIIFGTFAAFLAQALLQGASLRRMMRIEQLVNGATPREGIE